MYNINGLKNKLKDFYIYIGNFEIFILIETHVEEGELSTYNDKFSEYTLEWIPATRISRFGRARG